MSPWLAGLLGFALGAALSILGMSALAMSRKDKGE